MEGRHSPEEGQARAMIWRLIDRIGICMMVTANGATVQARPMRGAARPDANAIWFVADRASVVCEDATSGFPVCLTYADTKNQNYVSVTGRIAAVDDDEVRAELSNVALEAYFPGWPDNPAAMLLKFEPEFGEYWDAPSSPILMAIRFLQARVAGEPPNPGANGTAQLGPAPGQEGPPT